MTAGERHAQAVARGRQVHLCGFMVEKIDALLIDCAEAKITAPGLLEIREWCRHNIEENAALAEKALAEAGAA